MRPAAFDLDRSGRSWFVQPSAVAPLAEAFLQRAPNSARLVSEQHPGHDRVERPAAVKTVSNAVCHQTAVVNGSAVPLQALFPGEKLRLAAEPHLLEHTSASLPQSAKHLQSCSHCSEQEHKGAGPHHQCGQKNSMALESGTVHTAADWCHQGYTLSNMCDAQAYSSQSADSWASDGEVYAEVFSHSSRSAAVPKEHLPDASWHESKDPSSNSSSYATIQASMALPAASWERLHMTNPDDLSIQQDLCGLDQQPVTAQLSANPQTAPLFVGEDVPADVQTRLDKLKAPFCALPLSTLAEALQQAGFDVDVASNKCMALLGWDSSAADGGDSGPSDTGMPSAATEDSPPEPESPVHAQECRSHRWYDSQSVQVSFSPPEGWLPHIKP